MSPVNKWGEYICPACAEGKHLGVMHAVGICDCTCRTGRPTKERPA